MLPSTTSPQAKSNGGRSSRKTVFHIEKRGLKRTGVCKFNERHYYISVFSISSDLVTSLCLIKYIPESNFTLQFHAYRPVVLFQNIFNVCIIYKEADCCWPQRLFFLVATSWLSHSVMKKQNTNAINTNAFSQVNSWSMSTTVL